MSELRDVVAKLYDMAIRVEQELGAGLHGSQIRDLADQLAAIDYIHNIRLNQDRSDFDARD
jgi:hypothetical protein